VSNKTVLDIGLTCQPAYNLIGGKLSQSGYFVISTPHLNDNNIIKRGCLTGFSASYGPSRRFTSGDKETEKLFISNPSLARHLSLFNEGISLAEGISWLQDLQFKRYEDNEEADLLLVNLFAFINQADFLPNKTRIINISSGGVHFIDGSGGDLLVEELSDGYRSILSLTFDLLRQLSLHYGPNIFTQEESGKVTVNVSGVVQIDEVDIHLHPTWQRRIGFWLREHFPQIQFIVTTHSPLICQAAEKGSIFKLPTPGTEETGRMLVGEERDRLLYGNILDAYSTEAFGFGITRSPISHEMLERLSELNLKEVTGSLTQEEESEQEMLRGALPTSASTLADNAKA
jgi:hypothetical protein